MSVKKRANGGTPSVPLTFKELQQVGDYNSAFLNLDSSVVDAICMDIGVAKYEISAAKPLTRRARSVIIAEV